MSHSPSTTNLASIASRLGISISTVSRALRSAEGIHAETRTKIFKAAKELGYKQGKHRSTQAVLRPRNILALAQCSSPASDQVYRSGMNRASVALNVSILSHHLHQEECESILDPRFQPPALRFGMVDGLILIHRWPPEVARQLAEKLPTVAIIHHYPDASIDHIGIDDRMGMASLVEHLHARGARRIGFFGLCREMSWSCSRYAAYVESLEALGLPYEKQNVIEISLADAFSSSSFPFDDNWERTKERTANLDAWICSSAAASYTLCRAFLNHGIRMPEDISVAGYHSNSSVPADLPPLSSTVVADEELGAAAVRRIIHRLENPSESHRSILIPSRFVQGYTTIPPAMVALPAEIQWTQ